MRYAVILTVALVIYWFSLSGYFDKPLLIILGGVSVALVLGMCMRMRILGQEIALYEKLPLSIPYWIWLGKEIVKANFEVAKAVMSPDLEVSPTMIKVKTPPDTEIGKTNFANSITLTPGTVSVEIDKDEILVHALLEHMCDETAFDDMGQRAARAVGETVGSSS